MIYVRKLVHAGKILDKNIFHNLSPFFKLYKFKEKKRAILIFVCIYIKKKLIFYTSKLFLFLPFFIIIIILLSQFEVKQVKYIFENVKKKHQEKWYLIIIIYYFVIE